MTSERPPTPPVTMWAAVVALLGLFALLGWVAWLLLT